MQGYIILGVAIILNATANSLIKVSMLRASAAKDGSHVLFAALSQPTFWVGVVSFGLALAAYSLVLSKLNLSIAYPIMVSTGLVIITLISYFYLNESISLIQIFGFIFIIAGVWMVAK